MVQIKKNIVCLTATLTQGLGFQKYFYKFQYLKSKDILKTQINNVINKY